MRGRLLWTPLAPPFHLMARLALLVVFGLAGCAHLAPRASDGRSRHVGDLEQKVLAVGPALVTHVSAAGDGTLFLYTAPARTGTDDDCVVSDAEMQPYFPIPAGPRREVNLPVPAGQIACASVAMGMGMDVTWAMSPGTASASR